MSLALSDILTWCRWQRARRKAVGFERPKYLGRGLQIGSHVRIGRGADIGRDVHIGGDVAIGKNATLQDGVLVLGCVNVGDSTVIGRYTYVGTGPEGMFSIGANVLINDFSKLGAMKSVVIEDHCIFAAFIQITDAEHGMDSDQHVIYAPIVAEPVRIGEGVWLGSHVVVLKGVSVGARSVIGAHSLVRADIAADSVAFGIPARVQRARSTVV
jgi:acetyltransferase-like isoleucine patch superfamily enzyme